MNDTVTALTARTQQLEEALCRLLDEIEQLRCGCTAAECLSGHRSDCRMPWVNERAEQARQVLGATKK